MACQWSTATSRTRTLRALLSGAFFLASGCATVTVSTSEGRISARGAFGTSVRSFALAPATISRRGIGLHQDGNSMTLGWLAEAALYLPVNKNECRIVLVESDPAQLSRLITILRQAGADMATVCSQSAGDSQ